MPPEQGNLDCSTVPVPGTGGTSEMSVRATAEVAVATTNRAVTAHGGAVLLRETMRVVGVADAVEGTVRLK